MNCMRCGKPVEDKVVGKTKDGMEVISHTCLEVLDDDGESVGLVCPDCMTPEELAEVWELVSKSPDRLRGDV